MRRFPTRTLCGVAVLLSFFGIVGRAQTPGEIPASIQPRIKPISLKASGLKAADAVMRVDSSLVLISMHVTAPDGRSVLGLNKANFHVIENNIEQQITHFTQDDAPVSVSLLLDTSGSMKSKVEKVVQAARAFFQTSNPEDEFSLIEFADRAKLSVPFTPDASEISNRIERIRPFGMTSLFDAVHLALRSMKGARHERKALVILSDGGDNWSRHSAKQIKNELIESNVQVFAMGIFDDDHASAAADEERKGPQLLDQLAEQSGGRHYRVGKLEDLASISAKIGNELRNEYVLGYYPEQFVHDGKFHEVNVKLQIPDSMPHLRASYRRGYYAPTQ